MYSAVRLLFDRNTANLVIPVSLRDEGGICGYKSVYKLIRYWLCEGISRFFFEYWWLLHSFLALVPDDFNRNKKKHPTQKPFSWKLSVQCFLENEETRSQKWQAKSCPWEKSLETNVALISWLLSCHNRSSLVHTSTVGFLTNLENAWLGTASFFSMTWTQTYRKCSRTLSGEKNLLPSIHFPLPNSEIFSLQLHSAAKFRLFLPLLLFLQ